MHYYNNNYNNKLIRVEYIRKQISKENFINTILFRERDSNKSNDIRNIYDMFTQECRQCKGTGYIREEKLSNKFHTHFLEVSSIYG